MNANSQVKERILASLHRCDYVSVGQLARELDCSEMTVRRHLSRLESAGLVERSRGGAAISKRIRLEFALYERAAVKRAEKEAIGRAAAELVEKGERILLDTGTTTLEAARALRGREGIAVITTSLAIVSELLRSPGIECMLLGGLVRESSPDLYGPLLEENLSRIHADRAFIGCDGVTARGELTTTDARTARATALMIENSAEAVLLTDSGKAGRRAFFKFASLSQLDRLVTDDRMPEEVLEAARRTGAKTTIVGAAGRDGRPSGGAPALEYGSGKRK